MKKTVKRLQGHSGSRQQRLSLVLDSSPFSCPVGSGLPFCLWNILCVTGSFYHLHLPDERSYTAVTVGSVLRLQGLG